MNNKFRLESDISEVLDKINVISKKFNGKKVLITGGLGFLGRYILEIFNELKKSYNISLDVYALDNFITSSSNISNLYKKKNIKIINHDVTNKINLKTEFDYVISLAGIASPYYYYKYPFQTLDTTIFGLKNTFRVRHNQSTNFIFFSSSEIYGNPDKNNIPTKETYNGNVTSVGNRSCYDESKRIGETICYLESQVNKKKVKIIRPFNVFGPGMAINDYRIIPNIVRSFIQDKQLKIYSDGKQTRTYCYITDALNGFFRVFLDNRKFQIYNIGNQKNEISLNNLMKLSEKVVSKKIKYCLSTYPKEYPADEPLRRCPDITNAIKNLNFKPTVDLKEGLNRHFNWAMQNL